MNSVNMCRETVRSITSLSAVEPCATKDNVQMAVSVRVCAITVLCTNGAVVV